MSVSQRRRFEVLARDNFTCQYCGRKAPDVALHVDHIQPVRFGGGDQLTNLRTACQDCNLGKGSDAAYVPVVIPEYVPGEDFFATWYREFYESKS